MTQYTPNYHLDLYEDSDKPNLRGQYNAAITEIDQILFGLSNGQIAINNNIATLQTQVKNNEGEIAENLAAITKINGDIDGINVKLATDEANITSLQSSLETTNQNVSQTAGEVLAINGTLNTHDTRITAAQTTANEAGAKATTAQQESATQGAYWQALGVSTVDEAQDLNTDIQDAHTTSMENQGDIAKLKADVNNVDLVDWEVEHLAEFSTFTGSLDFFINKQKTAIKIGGVFAYTSSQYNNSVLIPGTSIRGFLLKENILTTTKAIIYANLGMQIAYDSQGVGTSFSGANVVLGTDGSLYLPANTANEGTIWWGMLVQSPLSVKQLNLSPLPTPTQNA